MIRQFYRDKIKGVGRMAEECRWVEDDEAIWNTDCDNEFVFIDSGPKENSMRFCCYCGKPLVAKSAGDMNDGPAETDDWTGPIAGNH